MIQSYQLTELCLTKIFNVQTAQLFVIISALGFMLAINGETGAFIQFLSTSGWGRDAKKEVRKLIQNAPLG